MVKHGFNCHVTEYYMTNAESAEQSEFSAHVMQYWDSLWENEVTDYSRYDSEGNLI